MCEVELAILYFLKVSFTLSLCELKTAGAEKEIQDLIQVVKFMKFKGIQ